MIQVERNADGKVRSRPGIQGHLLLHVSSGGLLSVTVATNPLPSVCIKLCGANKGVGGSKQLKKEVMH